MKQNQLMVQEVTSSHSALIPILFPQARDLKVSPALYAAFDAAAPDVLLGLALLASPIGTEEPAFRFGIETVDEPCREQVHRALLAHVITVATALRAPSLRNLQTVTSAAAQQRMAQFGFQLLRTTVTHTFALDAGFTVFDRQLVTLRAAGRIPADVLAEPYSAGNGHELSELCRSEFGQLTYGHLEAMGEYPAPGKDYSHAKAFRLGGALLGAWGVAVENGTATFDPLLIVVGKRNTWVFTYIIHSVLRQLIAHGIAHGRAKIHQDNLKMMALMRRIGAHTAGVDQRYELSLPPFGSTGGASS